MSIIGIDLGTTNCIVATYQHGTTRILDIFGHRTVPSVVAWDPQTGMLYVGHAAKKRVLLHPETAVVSNKRFIGATDKQYHILDHTYTPVDIAAILLRYLIEGATETLGAPVREAVVTVPAYFDANQKEATLRAAEQAGLKVLQLQAEPTAAAIAYGLHQEKDQLIMVYDLGGGTFDVSVLQVKGNQFTVKAVGGDRFLGGDDFDLMILDYLYKEIVREFGVDLRRDESAQARDERARLKERAEEAKIELSERTRTELIMPNIMGCGSFERIITRSMYRQLITPYLTRTISIMQETLRDAGMSPDDINRVICVGGSTKSPLVNEIIKNEIKQPFFAQNVDEIVACGAAITASSYLVPTQYQPSDLPVDLSAVNVTPFDLGIRLADDRFSVIIPKNTPIPVTVEKIYTTQRDNATYTEVVIFQGDEERCSNNIPLGGFRLNGIRRARAGAPRIRVTFELNQSDTLHIEGCDLNTQAIESLAVEKFQAAPYSPALDKLKTLEELRIGASRVGFDDVGAVLDSMRVPWNLVSDSSFSNVSILRGFDILFINCLAGGNARANKGAVHDFVADGGILYASDCAREHIEEAFPGEIEFESNNGFSGEVQCYVEDDEFAEALGKKRLKIRFNSVLYYAKRLINREGELFLSGKYGDKGKRPIVVGFPYGKGYVLFTAFHNYGTASKEEQELLKFVLLKPISVITGTSLEELSRDRT